MEIIKVLEKKIASLVELVKELKTENAQLAEENAQLAAKLSMLEASLLQDSQQLDDLKSKEKQAKVMVDSLIKSIDSLVGSQS